MDDKKDGGLIKSWQLHHLTIPGGKENEVLFLEHFPTAMFDPGPVMFTGTVVHDAAHRFQPGDHMRSTYIVSLDRERGVIETQNTIYKVIDEGDDVFPDLGNGVLNIFY
jgi:hypothetical protein